MSILGLICVLLALVATLLFVLFLFQRRDLRAVSQLSLTVQRAISGERLPSRIELEQQFEGQLDVQAIGVSVNQLLLRSARNAGREKSGPKLFTELGKQLRPGFLPARGARRARQQLVDGHADGLHVELALELPFELDARRQALAADRTLNRERKLGDRAQIAPLE